MPDPEVKFVSNTIGISRQLAVEYGLVEPTVEELAERARWTAEWQRQRRTFRGRLRRARSWLRAHRPRLHFGSCEDPDA